MRNSGIGGQAVMEGVMMRNKEKYAVAVRKQNNDIVVETREYHSLADRYKIANIPILRGVIAFVESMVMGINTLMLSADYLEEDEAKDGKKAEGSEAEKEAGEKDSEKKKAGDSVAVGLTVIIAIAAAVGIFMILPYYASRLLSGMIVSDLALALIEGIIRMVVFVLYVVAISQMKDIKRVFMYHGAEHKSINCIENGLPLTVENAKKQSREHKRCGTSFLLYVMIISIIFFAFIRVESQVLRVVLRLLLVPVIAGLAYEFIKLAGRSNSKVMGVLSRPGFWLQGLTTREPDESMLEVAICSVEAVFDWKAFLEEAESKEKKEDKKEDSLHKAKVLKTGTRGHGRKKSHSFYEELNQIDFKEEAFKEEKRLNEEEFEGEEEDEILSRLDKFFEEKKQEQDKA